MQRLFSHGVFVSLGRELRLLKRILKPIRAIQKIKAQRSTHSQLLISCGVFVSLGCSQRPQKKLVI